MPEEKNEETRIRVSFKISAKGEFQPDITSEAETVKTAMSNLALANSELRAYAKREGYLKNESDIR